jgi:hypothetical protein
MSRKALETLVKIKKSYNNFASMVGTVYGDYATRQGFKEVLHEMIEFFEKNSYDERFDSLEVKQVAEAMYNEYIEQSTRVDGNTMDDEDNGIGGIVAAILATMKIAVKEAEEYELVEMANTMRKYTDETYLNKIITVNEVANLVSIKLEDADQVLTALQEIERSKESSTSVDNTASVHESIGKTAYAPLVSDAATQLFKDLGIDKVVNALLTKLSQDNDWMSAFDTKKYNSSVITAFQKLNDPDGGIQLDAVAKSVKDFQRNLLEQIKVDNEILMFSTYDDIVDLSTESLVDLEGYDELDQEYTANDTDATVAVKKKKKKKKKSTSSSTSSTTGKRKREQDDVVKTAKVKRDSPWDIDYIRKQSKDNPSAVKTKDGKMGSFTIKIDGKSTQAYKGRMKEALQNYDSTLQKKDITKLVNYWQAYANKIAEYKNKGEYTPVTEEIRKHRIGVLDDIYVNYIKSVPDSTTKSDVSVPANTKVKKKEDQKPLLRKVLENPDENTVSIPSAQVLPQGLTPIYFATCGTHHLALSDIRKGSVDQALSQGSGKVITNVLEVIWQWLLNGCNIAELRLKDDSSYQYIQPYITVPESTAERDTFEAAQPVLDKTVSALRNKSVLSRYLMSFFLVTRTIDRGMCIALSLPGMTPDRYNLAFRVPVPTEMVHDEKFIAIHKKSITRFEKNGLRTSYRAAVALMAATAGKDNKYGAIEFSTIDEALSTNQLSALLDKIISVKQGETINTEERNSIHATFNQLSPYQQDIVLNMLLKRTMTGETVSTPVASTIIYKEKENTALEELNSFMNGSDPSAYVSLAEQRIEAVVGRLTTGKDSILKGKTVTKGKDLPLIVVGALLAVFGVFGGIETANILRKLSSDDKVILKSAVVESMEVVAKELPLNVVKEAMEED